MRTMAMRMPEGPPVQVSFQSMGSSLTCLRLRALRVRQRSDQDVRLASPPDLRNTGRSRQTAKAMNRHPSAICKPQHQANARQKAAKAPPRPRSIASMIENGLVAKSQRLMGSITLYARRQEN